MAFRLPEAPKDFDDNLKTYLNSLVRFLGGILNDFDRLLRKLPLTSISLDDDTAVPIEVGANNGWLKIAVDDGDANNFAFVYFRVSSTGAAMLAAGTIGTTFALGTGSLSGTTGTDGKVNLHAHTDGNIYLENRAGGTRIFKYIFECTS